MKLPLVWLVCSLSGVMGGSTLAAARFYVAPGGNDRNPGTKARPFATLEAAREAVGRLKAQHGLPKGGVTVYLRGGTYLRERGFVLLPGDGGAPGAPVTYRSHGKELVRLMGGVVLQGAGPISDPNVKRRLPGSARDKVLEVDLRSVNLARLSPMRSRGFGRPISPAHPELFIAGRPMTLARWPNEGQWEKIAGFPEGRGDDHGGKIGALTGGFNYSGDRPRNWQSLEKVWVHGYWAWDWANSYERIEAVDLEKRLIKTAPPHGLYGFRQGQRFYFLNVLEELDQPGEWHLDYPAGKLYFWPRPGAESAEMLLSVLEEPLITVAGASHVTVRGLTLETTRGHAVTIRDGQSNRVAGCVIRLVGNYGAWIEGGTGHSVVGCDIEDTGDGGVSLAGGDRQTLAAGGHVVENCHFQRQGRWSRCYVPAVLVNGVGHRVAQNLIHDHPHCAVLYSGNDHQIEFNEIHDVALETGDVGAIYAGRDWTYRGNVIRHNFIHHIGGVGMGSMGVYMDDCVSGTLIYGNVFYKSTRAAFLGGGRDHRVENNIFVDCRPAVQLDGRGLDKSPVWHNMVYDYMKKQLGAVPRELYLRRYPAIADVDRYYQSDQGVPPENNLVLRNVCAGGKWLEVGWHAAPKLLAVQDNLVDAAPGFVAPEKMDFRLRPDSPAWRLGFKAIPMERIGLRKDGFRPALTPARK